MIVVDTNVISELMKPSLDGTMHYVDHGGRDSLRGGTASRDTVHSLDRVHTPLGIGNRHARVHTMRNVGLPACSD
jgi:hypothetical protein